MFTAMYRVERGEWTRFGEGWGGGTNLWKMYTVGGEWTRLSTVRGGKWYQNYGKYIRGEWTRLNEGWGGGTKIMENI